MSIQASVSMSRECDPVPSDLDTAIACSDRGTNGMFQLSRFFHRMEELNTHTPLCPESHTGAIVDMELTLRSCCM